MNAEEMLGESEWVRPKAWKMDWELRKGREVMAKMFSPSMFGTAVRASFGNELFSLRKGGLRRPGAAIARLGEKDDLALLSFDAMGRGRVTFTDGTVYIWERAADARTWTVTREAAGALFSITRDARSKYPTGKVIVIAPDPFIHILMLLTWFIITTGEC
ncbi:MAG: hypothetical protein ISF22_07260 [Methanomassiliicoccus sp.]|nr:hypothetical protein [Methanomassiliicoccus sp.]